MKQFNYLSHKDLAVVVGGRNNWQTNVGGAVGSAMIGLQLVVQFVDLHVL